MSNKKNIVGAQVSSLRPYLQTPQELRASLQKLADMGYRTVQMQWWNPEFEPELVAAAVRDAGLTCVSTQDLYTARSSARCARNHPVRLCRGLAWKRR